MFNNKQYFNSWIITASIDYLTLIGLVFFIFNVITFGVKKGILK